MINLNINKKEIAHIILIIITFAILIIGTKILCNYSKYLNYGILEFRFYGYNSMNVLKYLYDLNENQRYYYISTFHLISVFYPITYISFFVTVFIYLLKKFNTTNKRKYFLIIFPIVGMICDYLENIFIKYIVNNYIYDFNNISEKIVSISSILTIIKFITIFGSIILIIILFLIITSTRNKEKDSIDPDTNSPFRGPSKIRSEFNVPRNINGNQNIHYGVEHVPLRE